MDGCSSPKNCSQNFDQEDCGQIPGALYKNYGCKSIKSATFDYFNCANRNDKDETLLFGVPPVPTKKAWQAINYNKLLNFDENQIYCGTRNVSYENFEDLYYKYGEENCQLKNNDSVKMSQLNIDLTTDFSFLQSPKLDKFQ